MGHKTSASSITQKRKTFPTKPWLKITLVLALGLVLFKGFLLVESLFKKNQAKLDNEPKITKSKKVSSQILEELICKHDDDCGVDICACKSLNKKYIKPNKQICMRMCEGKPLCYKNRCIFEGEEDKHRLDIE